MELEDLKTTWAEMNLKLEKQASLNEKMIKTMVQQQTTNKLKGIIYYELFGISVMLILMFLMGINIEKLDTAAAQFSAVVLLLICVVTLTFAYIHWKKINKIDISTNTIMDSLTAITEWKLFFPKYKMINYILAILLVFPAAIVAVKIAHNVDFTDAIPYYTTVIGIGLVIGIGITIIIYKKLYEDNMEEISKMFEDLK